LSPLCNKEIKDFAGGTAQPNLGAKDLKKFSIYLPPLQTQTAIVQKLDSLSSQVKQLEEIHKQKLKDLEELKKSMLQKAFSGELTNKNKG
jgi:type I restriction enzyme, S subunit